jgi:hypothetical protein
MPHPSLLRKGWLNDRDLDNYELELFRADVL